MENITISVNSLRALTAIAPGSVAHFCKCAARLTGKIALREQFRDGCNSMALAEVDEATLQQAITKYAKECRDTLWRLNSTAKNNGIKQPCYEVAEVGLFEVTNAVVAYVEELVGSVNAYEWLRDYDE